MFVVHLVFLEKFELKQDDVNPVQKVKTELSVTFAVWILLLILRLCITPVRSTVKLFLLHDFLLQWI